MSESRVGYEHADEWLYPNFAAWCEGSGRIRLHNVFSRAAIEIANTTPRAGICTEDRQRRRRAYRRLETSAGMRNLLGAMQELVRNSLPNSEVYSIENYELSKNEELLDISADFPCSQADNSAASKAVEENQKVLRSPSEFLTF
ncbi:MAG: hypothetical protein IPK83_24935 [Planctomycetes bacterium]|nr:hypothetical protein [Planctomycetota bacterium]